MAKKMWKRHGTVMPPAGFFVSVLGTAGGTGDITDPWDLHTAFAGGNPGGTIQPGDTVWLRNGTYNPCELMLTVNDAAMSAGSTTLTSATGGFTDAHVNRGIRVAGAGVGGIDLPSYVVSRSGGNTLVLSDPNTSGGAISGKTATIWKTGYICKLEGTIDAPITFRSYPGELATIDGNYAGAVGYPDSTECGNGLGLINLTGVPDPGKYCTIRNIRCKNTQANRFEWPNYTHARTGIQAAGLGDNVINCILDDLGQGISSFETGRGNILYGNVILHGGNFRYYVPNNIIEAAIDLVPADVGVAVALSGSSTYGENHTSGSGTWSHNNTGDCVVVVMEQSDSPRDYNNFTVTYGGVSMNLIVGNNGGHSWNNTSVAVFTLTNGQGAPAGANNVVINSSSSSRPIRGIAHSFVNVHQTTPATAKGTYTVPTEDGTLSPFTNTVASAANHMVVDVWYLGTPWAGTTPYGDNTTILRSTCGTGSQEIAMTSAPGAASVDMGWTMDYSVDGHSHGMYVQSFQVVDDAHSVVGDHTITAASGAPFHDYDLGATIVVEGAGLAGANLCTTITFINSANSIEVADAPLTGVAAGQALWSIGKQIRDNIIYDSIGDCTIQAYGSSGSSLLKSWIEGNFLAYKYFSVGGLSGFHLQDTIVENNYLWQQTAYPGYRSSDTSRFTYRNNYGSNAVDIHADEGKQLTMTGNTFVGTMAGFTTVEFPANDYSYILPASPPSTNVVVLRPNLYRDGYDLWLGRIYIFNWENLATVNVDISSMVPVGTPIEIRNGQDYFATPAYSGTYSGGTVGIPMNALTVQTGVGEPWPTGPYGTTGPGCGAFIVTKQGV